jgi:dTDP-4-amino-4,6-dideoxygalactose transaminase
MATTATTVTESQEVPVGWSLPSDRDASGRSFGTDEVELLTEVIRSGTLTSTNGTQTAALEGEFSSLVGVGHAVACSSGTAAIHAAIAALDIEPGDEVVTTAVTDMGGITPILYQGGIPVFADVDPDTCLVTAATIRPCLSERTRAIVVTHLFGNPCAMGPIMQVAEANGIPVIEDCAQAYLAQWDERLVGSFGTLACFSLQQGKHMTAGEGGLVVTSDPSLARRARLFVNKAWSYGEPDPDHEFLALNYRMTELQSAVARAQLARLRQFVERRVATAGRLSKRLEGDGGIGLPVVGARSVPSYWRYCLRIDEAIVPGGPDALATRLRAHGVAAGARYIQKPAFACRVIAEQRTFGSSRFPFTLARKEALDYSQDRFPGTFLGLRRALVLPWNERITDDDVDVLAVLLLSSVAELRGETR